VPASTAPSDTAITEGAVTADTRSHTLRRAGSLVPCGDPTSHVF
jgi:hypothetical protein